MLPVTRPVSSFFRAAWDKAASLVKGIDKILLMGIEQPGYKQQSRDYLIKNGITPQNGWRIFDPTLADLMQIPQARSLAQTAFGRTLLNSIQQAKCRICVAPDAVYKKIGNHFQSHFTPGVNAIFLPQNAFAFMLAHEAAHAGGQFPEINNKNGEANLLAEFHQAANKGEITKYMQSALAKEAGAYAVQYIHLSKEYWGGKTSEMKEALFSPEDRSITEAILPLVDRIARENPSLKEQLRNPSGEIPLELFDKLTAALINEDIPIQTHGVSYLAAAWKMAKGKPIDLTPGRFTPEQARTATGGALIPAGAPLPHTMAALQASGPRIAQFIASQLKTPAPPHGHPLASTTTRTRAPT